VTWWLLTWSLRGIPYQFVTDDREQADGLAIDLAEKGRENVEVMHFDNGPDLSDEKKQRVWEALVAERGAALAKCVEEKRDLHKLVGLQRDAMGGDWDRLMKEAMSQ
jgi:hypothetical protein